VDDIPRQGRTARGVTIMKLGPGDRVASIAPVGDVGKAKPDKRARRDGGKPSP